MIQLLTELRREFLLWRSYKSEAISGFIMWGVIFPLLIIIIQNVTITNGGTFGIREQLASILGFVIWRLCMRIFSDIPLMIQQEARTGTLENVVVSSALPMYQILAYRTIGKSIRAFVETLLLGIILLLIFRIPLPVTPFALTIILFTLLGTCGIGFALAGLALVYKVIGAISTTVANLALLISGATISIKGLGVIYTVMKFIFPTSWGIEALRDATILGINNVSVLVGLMLQTVIFITFGFIVFQWGLKKSKQDGSLATY